MESKKAPTQIAVQESPKISRVLRYWTVFCLGSPNGSTVDRFGEEVSTPYSVRTSVIILLLNVAENKTYLKV